jgi:hypothetical protein
MSRAWSQRWDAPLQRAMEVAQAMEVVRHNLGLLGYLDVNTAEPMLFGPTELEPTYRFYRPPGNWLLVVVPSAASSLCGLMRSAQASGAQELVLLVRQRRVKRVLQKLAITRHCAWHPKGCAVGTGLAVTVESIETLLQRGRHAPSALHRPLYAPRRDPYSTSFLGPDQ